MKKENERMQEILERLALGRERLCQIPEEASAIRSGDLTSFADYFAKTAEVIRLFLEEYDFVAGGGLKKASLEELAGRNERLYADVLPEHYGKSYANPRFAVAALGKEFGQMLSFLAAEVRSLIAFAYEQDVESMVIRLELFLEIYQMFVCAKEEEGGLPDPAQVKETLYWFASDYSETMLEKNMRATFDWEEDFALRIIMDSDLSDLRYLYRFGEYISGNELGISRYLAGLPQEEIDAMASTFTEGYRIGFVNAGIDLGKKKTVNIRYSLGFERIVRAAVEQFEKMGLQSIIYREARHSVNRRPQGNPGYGSTPPSKQYLFDHKEDSALYLDRKLVERKLSVLHSAYEEYKALAAVHAGPAVMEIFGERPFLPKSCREALKLDEKQQELSVFYNSEAGQLANRYIPGDERSFTIIAWPIPEIGENFKEIFGEIVKINNLDYRLYQQIQQKLIDALDQGAYVRVKGAGNNRTDMKVQLWSRNDPEKETIFENCVADVNIPVGEVFTSPKLTGTEGTLHVSEVYLNELKYLDLELTFRDGRIASYTCANFEDEEENKSFIRNNVLFNHETLPLGEFAIGTNTTAYMVAKKYDIGARLPILIAEKMGPHFAVGDTCFSWSEDNPTFNPDGKRIIAKDNECSILRREDVSKAYFNCHTDITIPYDELGSIRVVRPDGSEIPLIENGRFVLPGTEELNRPFEEEQENRA